MGEGKGVPRHPVEQERVAWTGARAAHTWVLHGSYSLWEVVITTRRLEHT